VSFLKLIFSLLGAFFALTATVCSAESGKGLQGNLTWRDNVLLDAVLRIEPGEELVIAPGTTVRPQSTSAKIIVAGTLRVEGSADAPVVFSAPPGWEGIEFIEATDQSSISYAHFSQAEIAISSVSTNFRLAHCRFVDGGTAVKLLRESSPTITDSLFSGNRIGIHSEMKSNATVRQNRFVGHKTAAILAAHNSLGAIEANTFEENRHGIDLMQKYSDRISRNHFSHNDVGIYCNQSQKTPRIFGNDFVGNRIGVENTAFSSPDIENNRFSDNDIALRNDQLCSPKIGHNLFRDNRTAIYNYRKSNPDVQKNRFEINGLAIFCDYSSYPAVHQNDFARNGMAVRLGIYQSGDWERKFNSKTIMMEQVSSRNGRSPLPEQMPGPIADTVNVSHNWWGEDTIKFKQAGPGGELEMFHDRRDQPEVFYEGYGPGGYALDVVVFEPWLTAPVADSGPAN